MGLFEKLFKRTPRPSPSEILSRLPEELESARDDWCASCLELLRSSGNESIKITETSLHGDALYGVKFLQLNVALEYATGMHYLPKTNPQQLADQMVTTLLRRDGVSPQATVRYLGAGIQLASEVAKDVAEHLTGNRAASDRMRVDLLKHSTRIAMARAAGDESAVRTLRENPPEDD
jgi:hypothetical protein